MDVVSTASPPGARRPALRDSLRAVARLAAPVITAELGWMSMGIVDTVMVSPLGPAAIGAVGIGSILFMAVGIFGMGLLLGLDTVVSQAFGGGDDRDGREWLVSGLWLALLACVPLAGVLFVLDLALGRFGLHPDVEPLVRGYVRIVNLSLPPLLLYAGCRRYLQGVARVKPIAFALVSANLVNVLVNWLLIEGRLGFPALGVQGAAFATFFSRLYLFAVLAGAIAVLWRSRRLPARVAWTPSAGRLARLVRLGVPAAAHLLFEVGVFAAATALAGRLTPDALAAHHIALSIASVTFMVPLGVSSAGAVLVGHGIGQRDPHAAAGAGWSAILLVIGLSACAALAFWWRPALWIGLFTTDAAVIAIGQRLLLVAAAFQLFDAVQVTATGVLRGLGETRRPMVVGLVGYWCVALPLGYLLCFRLSYGVVGLWLGLCAGLMLVGLTLLYLWHRRIRTAVTARPLEAVPA